MKFSAILGLVLQAYIVCAQGQTFAVTHARLVDGNGGPPVPDATILVDGAKILAVSNSSLLVPPQAQVLDATGKTVIPGLADMHVHLVGGWDGGHSDLLGYQNYLNALLYAGVTTVLDTGNIPPFILQLREAVSAGQVAGPRIYCVGPLIDGPDPLWAPISVPVASTQQVSSIVKQLADEKVDLVKLYVGLSDPIVRAMSDEARKRNLRTIIDQGDRNGSIDLMTEGISGFAHLPFHRISDDAVQLARSEHIFFISTLAVQESLSERRLRDSAFLNESLLRDTMPTSQYEALRRFINAGFSKERLQRSDAAIAELKNAETNVKRLWDAGIIIAAGTDAPYPGDSQGEGLHRELELLVEAGLTPMQAISAATKNAALIMNAGMEWGTIEAGKRADFLLIDGRPDENIRDTRRISSVIQGGKLLDREALKFNPHSTDFETIGNMSSQ